jgi:hypothetical protein
MRLNDRWFDLTTVKRSRTTLLYPFRREEISAAPSSLIVYSGGLMGCLNCCIIFGAQLLGSHIINSYSLLIQDNTSLGLGRMFRTALTVEVR